MTIIVLLISISLSIAVMFLLLFLWSMRNGQYEDTYAPAARILFENKPTEKTQTPKYEHDSDTAGKTAKKI